MTVIRNNAVLTCDTCHHTLPQVHACTGQNCYRQRDFTPFTVHRLPLATKARTLRYDLQHASEEQS